jgi:hypothetical protein
MSGLCDFVPKVSGVKDMFGLVENFLNMEVTNFIDGDEPPILLIYTGKDDTFHSRNLEGLKAGIANTNGTVQIIIYNAGRHAAPVAAFSWANPPNLPVPEDIDDFFKTFLFVNQEARSNNQQSTILFHAAIIVLSIIIGSYHSKILWLL